MYMHVHMTYCACTRCDSINAPLRVRLARAGYDRYAVGQKKRIPGDMGDMGDPSLRVLAAWQRDECAESWPAAKSGFGYT